MYSYTTTLYYMRRTPEEYFYSTYFDMIFLLIQNIPTMQEEVGKAGYLSLILVKFLHYITYFRGGVAQQI